MTTIELEARKTSLIRQILDVNDDKALQKLEKWMARFMKKESTSSVTTTGPHTLEEVNQRLDKAEEDIAAGRTCTSDEAFDMIENEFPYLCK